MGSLIDTIRADAWWEHKLSPVLGSGYMTTFFLGASLLDVWPALLFTLAALSAAAAYVSVINDLTDIDDDRLAGKRNRFAGRSAPRRAAALVACLAVGAAAAVAWRHDPLALGLYACGWVSFSLYSIPPVRLKGRGFLGALADGAGAHLFPQLLVVVVVFHRTGAALDAAWVATVGGWALAHGLRGALWHQLGDAEADTRAGVRTFGSVHPRRAQWLARLAFAAELAAFGVLLWRSGNVLALSLVPTYIALETVRSQLWGVTVVIAGHAPRARIAMNDFYIVFYPLSFLVAATLRHPLDALVLLVQVALFPRHLRAAIGDAARATRSLVAER